MEEADVGKIDVLVGKKHKENPTIVEDKKSEVEQEFNIVELPSTNDDSSVIIIKDEYITEKIEKIREEKELEDILSKQTNVEIVNIDEIINGNESPKEEITSNEETNKEEKGEEKEESNDESDEDLKDLFDEAETEKDVNNENIYMVGKNEKNLIKKVIKLKKMEIKSILSILLVKDAKKGKYKKIIAGKIDEYIELKYFNRENIKFSTINQFTVEIGKALTKIFKELMDQYDDEENINFVKKLYASFNIINKLDNIKIDDITPEVIGNSLEFVSIDLTIDMLKKKINSYRKLYDSFIQKLSSKHLHLVTYKLDYENKENIELYGTNILAKIEFNKIFSDYIIKKSFEEEVIVENLREVQLKMISLRLTEGFVGHSFNNKYLINFPISVYAKSKKVKSLFSCINDSYSQNSIIIVINIEIIRTYFKDIVDLRKDGYKFGIEIASEYVNYLIDLKEVMPLAEYVLISGSYKDIDEMRQVIPAYLVDKIIYIDKSLSEGVIIE